MIILRRFEFLTIETSETTFQVRQRLIPKEQRRQHTKFDSKKPVEIHSAQNCSGAHTASY